MNLIGSAHARYPQSPFSGHKCLVSRLLEIHTSGIPLSQGRSSVASVPALGFLLCDHKPLVHWKPFACGEIMAEERSSGYTTGFLSSNRSYTRNQTRGSLVTYPAQAVDNLCIRISSTKGSKESSVDVPLIRCILELTGLHAGKLPVLNACLDGSVSGVFRR